MSFSTTSSISTLIPITPSHAPEEQGPISTLILELFHKIISRLDQQSKLIALGVNSSWKANVIAQAQNEKAIVENLIKFIVAELNSTVAKLDKTKPKHSKIIKNYSQIIKDCESCLAKHPIFLCSRLPGSMSKNTWFFNVRRFLAIQLSFLSEAELTELQKTFKLREESYFSNLPELALLYKALKTHDANTTAQEKLYSIHQILRDEFPKKGYFDEAIKFAAGLSNHIKKFPLMRAVVLSDLSDALTEAKYLDKALKVAARIMELVPTTPLEDESGHYEDGICDPQIEALELQGTSLRRIAWAHQEMAKECKLSAAKAFEIACMLPTNIGNDNLFFWIGQSLMDQQNFDGAFVSFERIIDKYRCDDGKHSLAINLFNSGDRHRSLAVIKTMHNDSHHKVDAIVYNTRALFKEKDLDGTVNVGCMLKDTSFLSEPTVGYFIQRPVAYLFHQIMAALLDNKDLEKANRLYKAMPDDGPNGYRSCTIRDIALVEFGELRRCHESNPAQRSQK